MSNKDKYRLLCNTEKNIPIFSHDWWLDTVCGEKKWDVLLIEQKGKIQATLPLYVPHSDIVSMPSYTQTMGPWFTASSSDTKYTTELGRRQELCKQFTEELKRYPHFLQNFNYDITDWLPFYWAGYNQTTRYTYLLKNIRDHQAVWENMSPNIRRNITKAQNKYHISVKKGIPLNEFLAVQAQTFDRQHVRIKEDTNVMKELVATCRQRGQVNEDTITLINNHLESNKLTKEDKVIYGEVMTSKAIYMRPLSSYGKIDRLTISLEEEIRSIEVPERKATSCGNVFISFLNLRRYLISKGLCYPE